MNVNEDELWARLESTAGSLYDRMMILEARDKLLRLYRERQTNIGKFLSSFFGRSFPF